MKTYTSGPNAWYTRLAVERLIWNQLLLATDPDAHQSFRRIMQNQPYTGPSFGEGREIQR
jgi:hypothetical protein